MTPQPINNMTPRSNNPSPQALRTKAPINNPTDSIALILKAAKQSQLYCAQGMKGPVTAELPYHAIAHDVPHLCGLEVAAHHLHSIADSKPTDTHIGGHACTLLDSQGMHTVWTTDTQRCSTRCVQQNARCLRHNTDYLHLVCRQQAVMSFSTTLSCALTTRRFSILSFGTNLTRPEMTCNKANPVHAGQHITTAVVLAVLDFQNILASRSCSVLCNRRLEYFPEAVQTISGCNFADNTRGMVSSICCQYSMGHILNCAQSPLPPTVCQNAMPSQPCYAGGAYLPLHFTAGTQSLQQGLTWRGFSSPTSISSRYRASAHTTQSMHLLFGNAPQTEHVQTCVRYKPTQVHTGLGGKLPHALAVHCCQGLVACCQTSRKDSCCGCS